MPKLTESKVLFDVGEIDRIMHEEPTHLVAYLIVIAGYNRLYDLRPETDDIKITAHEPDKDGNCLWEIHDILTNSGTLIMWQGFSSGGNMKLRMNNSRYPGRKWHTVLLPIKDFHYVELDSQEAKNE